MDNVSLEQLVNRILLPNNRYIGSFRSDFVPILPNDIFAIIRTHPNNTPGEHWILTAISHHVTYFSDSLGLSIKNYPFFKQKCRQVIPTRRQGNPSVCGFYTMYAAFHRFKFQQEELTGVIDVKVFSFAGKYS